MINRDQTVVEHFDPEKSTENLSHMKFIEKKIDLGDIIGIEGNLFYTQKGELTVFVKKLTLLCKALLPFPTNIAALSIKK